MSANLFKVSYESVDACLSRDFLTELDRFRNDNGTVYIDIQDEDSRYCLEELRCQYPEEVKAIEEFMKDKEGSDFLISW